MGKTEREVFFHHRRGENIKDHFGGVDGLDTHTGTHTPGPIGAAFPLVTEFINFHVLPTKSRAVGAPQTKRGGTARAAGGTNQTNKGIAHRTHVAVHNLLHIQGHRAAGRGFPRQAHRPGRWDIKIAVLGKQAFVFVERTHLNLRLIRRRQRRPGHDLALDAELGAQTRRGIRAFVG